MTKGGTGARVHACILYVIAQRWSAGALASWLSLSQHGCTAAENITLPAPSPGLRLRLRRLSEMRRRRLIRSRTRHPVCTPCIACLHAWLQRHPRATPCSSGLPRQAPGSMTSQTRQASLAPDRDCQSEVSHTQP